MFSAWKQEKATAALVEDAQAMADRLSSAKPHVRDSYAATARFWELSYLAEGHALHDLSAWKPAAVARFVTSAQGKIAALRKARDYDSSDGLAVWLHTARAVTEPRIAPAVRDIWQALLAAGPNAASMTADLLADAGLTGDPARSIPKGFDADDTP
ncbi:hypothetical protein [Paragemmobacter straminiformis]|uniref:Uncharacterized protein n=1 Tax=Paragemmobacter straminiformis TaxID=2045119 RepID=A0A842I5L9_9RHOB|nr:hypothetical protein [Gemmobacter straminiformis]MBC2834667.1 hypothetical protein [Gemmobacter straminiformis]